MTEKEKAAKYIEEHIKNVERARKEKRACGLQDDTYYGDPFDFNTSRYAEAYKESKSC